MSTPFSALHTAGPFNANNFQLPEPPTVQSMCLDLQACLHVQWLRFQHISAYSLRKTSGNTKDNCSVYHQVSCASNYPLHACRFIHHLSPQWNNKMTFAKACVATLAVAACAAGGVDARRGVAGLSLEHNGRALTQSRSLSCLLYTSPSPRD